MPHEQKDDDEKKLVKITINGIGDEQPKGEYTFDQIVAITKRLIPDIATGPNILYTITYRGADGHKPEGRLVEGGTVKIKDKTIFNVTPSDKS